MKKIVVFLLLFLNTFISARLFASNPYCENLGFELGNFTNWEGYSWISRSDYTYLSTNPTQGIVSGRHTIMTDTTAYDANTGGKLKKIPVGARYSARLGDAVKGGLFESLRYTMTVDSTNALLVWKFAVVLQNPLSGHTKQEEPRFRITLFNQHNDTIPSCANYDVYASDASIVGFQTYTPTSGDPILWRDWTTVGANLLPYMGQTVTIEFMAGDCTHVNHYGYAYFVAACNPMYITVKYCTGDNAATLEAPEGFVGYEWKNSKDSLLTKTRQLVVNSPVEGALYHCTLTSATGCQVTLNSVIAKYEPNADFDYDLMDCNALTNTVKFYNTYPAKHGTLSYKWDFGDGTSSTEKNPVHAFTTSGQHPVSLVVTNPPSVCKDSVSKMVETFFPPLIGIGGDSTYCPGKTTTLSGVGAYSYKWSNGSTNNTIEVGKDTTVWLIGYSSKGCYTDTIRCKVKEEPDWVFDGAGDSIFCIDTKGKLSASGAETYLWNTGEKTSSIEVDKTGTFTVLGQNKRGCEKSISFNIKEIPLPITKIQLSSSTVDSKNHTINCTVSAESDVQYLWSMGDGRSESGASISHSYQIIPGLKEYIITLTATNTLGCSNSSSQTIDVIPFIPNVFSPNNDGVNDYFMEGYQVQVFDRMGMEVFNGKEGWDGKYKGKSLDNDTYYYLVYYTDKNQQEKTMKGYVMLKK